MSSFRGITPPASRRACVHGSTDGVAAVVLWLYDSENNRTMALFSRHSPLHQAAYSDLKRRALEQLVVLVGTPGSVSVRAVKGSLFYYRQYYDAAGRKAATSYKLAGAGRFRVDLLAPTSQREITVTSIPELSAHATALPHFASLLVAPIDVAVLGREGAVAVMVPRPEAFAWHKLLVSTLRGTTRDKQRKDVDQATVLLAVLAEDAPDALEGTFACLPPRSKARTRDAAKRVVGQLREMGHARAADVVGGIV